MSDDMVAPNDRPAGGPVLMVTTAALRPGGGAAYERYAAAVIPLIEAAGGRVEVRAVGREALEGPDFPGLVAVIRFPSAAAAHGMMASAAYRAAVPDREQAFDDLRTFLCDAL